jgi:hypothetical protein
MLNWLSNFQIEKYSFFIGFATALIFVFAINRIKKLLPDLKKFLVGYLYNYNKIRLTKVRDTILNEAFSRAQSNHFTKDLFTLDEIIIEPTFLIQPEFNLDENILFKSEITSVVPFIPEYPILSRNYNVPRLTISEVIQKNANLVICGVPGSGKTVALSHLVAKLITNQNDEFSHKITPFFISVHDIDIENPQKNVVQLITEALLPKVNGVSFKQVQSFVKNEASSNNCLLLIDDLDELHPVQYDKLSNILENILQENSKIQVITTSTPFYFGKLTKLGFTPIYLSAWSSTQTLGFYEKWNSLWRNQIEKRSSNSNSSENALIKAWSTSRLQPMTPLEHTLYIWGTSSGDLSGYEIENLMYSYINRLLPKIDQLNKIKVFAMDCINRRSLKLNPNQKLENIEDFFELGLVSKTSPGDYAFTHMNIMAFLASKLNEEKNIVFDDDDLNWPIIPTYFGFRSTDAKNLIDFTPDLKNIPSQLMNIYKIGYLLRFSKPDSQFRTKLIKYLINLIFEKEYIFSIRLRSLAALLQCNDPNIPVFIKQLFSKKDLEFIQFALFAIGSTNKDPSFIKEILPLTKIQSINLRKLVYLVLTTFDDELAIHELGKAFLSEDEKVRQIIAESFAFNNPEGEEILKEAISLTDIVVRRSAIFGLVKLKNDWAKNTLQTLSIEDNQWVIRNAALQASEFLSKENPLTPQNVPPIHQNLWLRKFAGENNLGVAPGKSTVHILKMALSSEDSKTISNAAKLMMQENNDEIIVDLENKLRTIKDQLIIDQILFTLFTITNTKNSVDSA